MILSRHSIHFPPEKQRTTGWRSFVAFLVVNDYLFRSSDSSGNQTCTNSQFNLRKVVFRPAAQMRCPAQNWAYESYIFSKTYVTNDVSTEAKLESVEFKQLAGRTVIHYSEVIYENLLDWAGIYDEKSSKGFFFESLHSSILFSGVSTEKYRKDLRYIAWHVTRPASLNHKVAGTFLGHQFKKTFEVDRNCLIYFETQQESPQWWKYW